MSQEQGVNISQLSQVDLQFLEQAFAKQQQEANEAMSKLQQQLQSVQLEATRQVNALQQQLLAQQAAASGVNTQPVTSPVTTNIELSRGIKLPTLDTFAGEKDEDLSAFLFQLQEHLDISGITDDTLKIRVAGMALRGVAKTWYAYVRNSLTPEHEKVKTFADFLTGLKAHFTPMDPIKIARDELAELKQTKTVREYTAAFRKLNLRIPGLSEDERLDRYIRGLKPKTRRELEIREPETFEAATRLAEKLDVVFERAYTPDNRDKHQYQPTGTLDNTNHNYLSDPMILGAIQERKKGSLTQEDEDGLDL